MNLILVSSITYANKAKRYLASRGIRAVVIRTPHDLSAHGCGYCLKTTGNPYLIAEMLKAAGIVVTGIYTY